MVSACVALLLHCLEVVVDMADTALIYKVFGLGGMLIPLENTHTYTHTHTHKHTHATHATHTQTHAQTHAIAITFLAFSCHRSKPSSYV